MCHVIVGFNVLCVALGFHVVIGVGRLTVEQESFICQLHFTTHTHFETQKSFLVDDVVFTALRALSKQHMKLDAMRADQRKIFGTTQEDREHGTAR